MFLKLKNKFLIIIFIFLICEAVFASEEITNTKEKINLYIENFKNLSSEFIQIEGLDISTGFLYIKNKRIKIQYKDPTEIIIILSKNKAMYFNKDLDEVEYFNPKKTIGDVFYNVFYNKNFFNDSVLSHKEKSLEINKKIYIEGEESILKVFFETSPLIIRRVVIEGIQKNKLTLSISNINHSPIFEKNFFSMANPILK